MIVNMKLLEEKILKYGNVPTKDVLKVDYFLNHQVDTVLMQEIGKEFAEHFKYKNITKVVTIESSGIAPALMTAIALGVELIILKKQSNKVLSEDILQVKTKSFTKNTNYDLTLSKKYISTDDNVLIIDDFLANGAAASSACKLIEMAGGTVAGIGIVIEKSFQPGRKLLDNLGFDVYSLARISKLSPEKIEFLEELHIC